MSRKIFLQDAINLAKKRNGKCLSKEYVNNSTKLQWQCEKGHIWEAIYNNIQRGTWCPVCGGNAKKTIEDAHELAKKMGGKCLSTKYINVKAKMKWQCQYGHIWEAKYNNIQQGNWCPKCAGKNKTIEDMQKLAEKQGGKCLSKKYVNNKAKLIWECSEGHVWETTPSIISNGNWCPACAGNQRKTMEDAQRLAKKNNGKCLSKKYINSSTYLIWQCEHGHTWEAVYEAVRAGNWCPYCAGRRKTIEDVKKLAREKGGQCLSAEYIGATAKYTWQCSEGHIWEATYNSIQSNHWCPCCCQGKSERAARKAIEKVCNAKFPSSWPDFLNGLQLDCYNKELKLALEYQGKQHYEFVDYFHAQQDILDDQIERDKRKKQLCDKHGVVLIYLTHKDKTEDFESLIQKKLKSCNLYF